MDPVGIHALGLIGIDGACNRALRRQAWPSWMGFRTGTHRHGGMQCLVGAQDSWPTLVEGLSWGIVSLWCVCVRVCWEVAAASAPWTQLGLRAQGQTTRPSCHLLVQLKCPVRGLACRGEAEQSWPELPGPRAGMDSGLGAEGMNW